MQVIDEFTAYGALTPVQDPVEQERLVQPMRQVFATFHPWRTPIFTDAIPRGLVVVWDDWVSNVDKFRLIVEAATAMGDATAMFVQLAPWLDAGVDLTWGRPSIVPLDVTAHADLHHVAWYPIREASALCSPTGTWGAMTSDDGFAFIGGPDAFMDIVEAAIDVKSNAFEFLAEEARNTRSIRRSQGFEGAARHTLRVRGLMRHLYGDERGSAFLRKAGWG